MWQITFCLCNFKVEETEVWNRRKLTTIPILPWVLSESSLVQRLWYLMENCRCLVAELVLCETQTEPEVAGRGSKGPVNVCLRSHYYLYYPSSFPAADTTFSFYLVLFLLTMISRSSSISLWNSQIWPRC